MYSGVEVMISREAVKCMFLEKYTTYPEDVQVVARTLIIQRRLILHKQTGKIMNEFGCDFDIKREHLNLLSIQGLASRTEEGDWITFTVKESFVFGWVEETMTQIIEKEGL